MSQAILSNGVRALALGSFGLLVAACGGSSSTAEFRLMDAPPAGVTAVNVWVAAIQVHVVDNAEARDADPNDGTIDDDNKWLSLVVNRSIDLVQHQGETAAELLGQLPLPAGKITQIRLILDTTKPNTATRLGVACNLDTSEVVRKGIKINHPFKAFGGNSKYAIWVDFKLDESLIENGTCFTLKPKLKLHKVKVDDKDATL